MPRTALATRAQYSSVVCAVLLLIPRLLSPEFGLLDDAVTITVAKGVCQDPGLALRMGSDTGRFIPAYWLYYSAIYFLAQARPLFFFVANSLLLAATALALVYFMRWRGASGLQAGATGLFFVLSGPTIENFYTLSKAEPLQVAMSVIGLALLAGMNRHRIWHARALLLMASAGAFLLACCSKETSVALLSISVGWLSLHWLHGENDPMRRRERIFFVATSLAASATYFLLRSFALSTSVAAGSYSRGYQFSSARLMASLTTWASWLVRDFPYFLPLAAFACWLAVRGKQPHARLLGDALVWMVCWAAVFFPWQSTLEYYLLPFAVGVAMFSGVVLGELISRIRSTSTSPLLRTTAATIAVLVLVTQINNCTAARFQVTVDAANTDLLEFVSGLPERTRFLVNVPKPNEYVYELGEHLSQLRNRPDIRVDYFSVPDASSSMAELPFYVATPILKNQMTPSPRIAVYESGAREWEQALLASSGDSADPVYESLRKMRIVDIGLERALCPLLRGGGLYCFVDRPVLDTRELAYGWRVYRVSSHMSKNESSTWRVQGNRGRLE